MKLVRAQVDSSFSARFFQPELHVPPQNHLAGAKCQHSFPSMNNVKPRPNRHVSKEFGQLDAECAGKCLPLLGGGVFSALDYATGANLSPASVS